MYNYKAKDRKIVTVDFIIIGMNKKCVCPKVSEDGKELHVGFVIPSFFMHNRRLELADMTIHHNTHKLTAYRDLWHEIIAKHGDGTEEEPLLGEPQAVQLPFTVELRFGSGKSKPLRMMMRTSISTRRRLSNTSLF